MVGQNEEVLSLFDLAEVLRDRYGEEETRAIFQEARNRLYKKRQKINEAVQNMLNTVAPIQIKPPWYYELVKEE